MTGPDHKPEPSLFARVGRVLERYRLPIELTVDITGWAIGLYLAMVLRFEAFSPPGWNSFGPRGLLTAMAVAAGIQTASGMALGLSSEAVFEYQLPRHCGKTRSGCRSGRGHRWNE